MALAGFGFLLGMRHATDADHVIAITTILNRTRRVADTTLIGALWGAGHTITVVTVGVLIIVFNVVIPPALGLAMEFAVALMLIGLGVLNLTGGLGKLTEQLTPPAPPHAHEHAHTPLLVPDKAPHSHLHGHGADRRLSAGFGASLGWYQLLRPLVVGVVHGLAGSAAVALLVLGTIESTGAAIAYLVIFCLGVAAGMAVLTTVIGLPLLAANTRWRQINRWLTVGSGLLSLAFGLYLAYQIGIVDGLFTGDFTWAPA